MMITMVVVIYNTKISDSKTWQSVIINKEKLSLAGISEILIYDNSYEKQSSLSDIGDIPIMYVHDRRNLGIQVAYTKAFEIAQKNNSSWIALFDQDTKINKSYFDELISLGSSALKENKSCAALYPQIYQDAKLLSPFLKEGVLETGFTHKFKHGINSASIISTMFLKEINGFSQAFPLDYLDHWLNYEMVKRKKKVYVMSAKLEHSLSVGDIKSVSPLRLKSILISEKKFQKMYKPTSMMRYYIQFLIRVIKYLVLDPKKVPIAIKVLFTRL